MALLSAALVESLEADAVAVLEVDALVVEAALVEEEAEPDVAVELAEPDAELVISARTVALKVPVMPVKLFGFQVMIEFKSRRHGKRGDDGEGK